MKRERAPVWRRIGAAVLDASVAVTVAIVVALMIARVPFFPAPGWFWSEWLLKIWLDEPTQLLAPAGVCLLTWLIWNLVWEGFAAGTPGARAFGIEVVTSRGRPLRWGHAIGRALGFLGDLATLGFGLAWMLVDPDGRALHDVVSRTWVVRSG